MPYEDVFFTGIVAGMYLKIPRTSVKGIMGYNDRMPFDLEQYATRLISSHKHKEDQVETWWTSVMEYRKNVFKK